MMNAKKRIGILILSALLFCFAANAFCEAMEPDYYRIGLKVTGTMGEIIDSETFLSLFTSSDTFSKERDELNTHDYDSPVAVYALRCDPDTLLEKLMLSDPDSGEMYNSLSPALQDQIRGRISIQTLVSMTNARAGAEYIALASIATASIRDDSLTGDEAPSYLYVFGKGAPVLVSFGHHNASGMFLLIPEESRKTPEDIASYLALPGVELVPVDEGI